MANNANENNNENEMQCNDEKITFRFVGLEGAAA